MDYEDNPYLRILNALSSPDLDENYVEKPRSKQRQLSESHGQRSKKKLLTGNRTSTSIQKRAPSNKVARRMTREQSAQSYMAYANYLIEEMDNESFNGMWFVSEDEMPFYESMFGAYREEESGYGDAFRDSYAQDQRRSEQRKEHRRGHREKSQSESYSDYSYAPPPSSDDTAFDRINRKRKKLLEELGLPETASVEDAKREYRKLMLKYHPDKIVRESDETKREYEEKAKRINEAYDKIKNQKFLD